MEGAEVTRSGRLVYLLYSESKVWKWYFLAIFFTDHSKWQICGGGGAEAWRVSHSPQNVGWVATQIIGLHIC